MFESINWIGYQTSIRKFIAHQGTMPAPIKNLEVVLVFVIDSMMFWHMIFIFACIIYVVYIRNLLTATCTQQSLQSHMVHAARHTAHCGLIHRSAPCNLCHFINVSRHVIIADTTQNGNHACVVVLYQLYYYLDWWIAHWPNRTVCTVNEWQTNMTNVRS